MNRLTNAFTSAIPSSGSDVSSHHARDSPRTASPLDSSFSLHPQSAPRARSQDRRHITQNLIYDDPRMIFHPSSEKSGSGVSGGMDRAATMNLLSAVSGINRPGRPGILRHLTDDGSGRSGSQMPTPRVRSESRSRERDRGVRVNLMSGQGNGARRGWGMNSATNTTRLNGMAEGPDGKYAVGGGQYLRVMKISDPSSGSSTPVFSGADDPSKEQPALARGTGGVTITEVVNLWKPSWPVSKGVNAIDWGIGKFDNKIATATPGGTLMLFDVERGKLDKEISSGTFRPMNCVQFCRMASHGHIALTGGTEGGVRFWDLRERDPSNRKNLKHSAGVTALCFSPDDPYQFVAGLEDGSIRRYDFRSPQRSVGKAYGAHGSKAVMDLKWKQGEEAERNPGGWLASAGADRIVQVWDMGQSWDKPPTPVHTLHTSHPIRRIAWRPNRPTELVVVPLIQPLSSSDPGKSPNPKTSSASAASSLAAPDPTPPSSVDDDAHLEIWHVRRHHIAKYALPSHDGVAVDVNWAHGDDNLVACFQNGGFAQINIKGRFGIGSVPLPLDQIPRQVVGWSPRDEIVYALDRFKMGEIPFDDVKPEYATHWDKIGRPTASIADPAYEPLQTLGFLPLRDVEEDEFVYLANWYRIEGDTPEHLCQWNRNVAMSCGREDDAQLWSFLKALVEEFAPSPPRNAFREDMFSGTMPGSTRLPTPPTMSPGRAGSPTRQDRVQLRDRRPSPIPLARVNMALLDDDDASSESSCSSSSCSYSDSETSASSQGGQPKSRFLAFAPPETIARRLSETTSSATAARRESTATIVGRSTSGTSALRRLSHSQDRRSSHSSDEKAQGDQSAGALSASTSKKSSLGKMTASRIMAMSDWPDPYGIEAEPTSTGMTSRTSTRSSPTPLHLDAGGGARPLRASPLPLTSLRNSVSDESRRRSADLHGASESRRGSRLNSIQEGAVVKGRQERFDRGQWEEYKSRRVASFFRWWDGCIEDGEMQLATIISIVGRGVAEFPSAQVERLAHAYVDMLERHRLAVPASYIRRYGDMLSLQIISTDEGMTHVSHCQRCGKSTGELDDIGVEGKVFWWCKRCKSGAKKCAICRRVVKGLWMGCRKCGHGGHQPCMRLYHDQAPLLPVQHAQAQALDVPDKTYLGSATNITLNGSVDGGDLGTAEEVSAMESQIHVQGSQGLNDLIQQGWTVCPTGCGCKCRRVGGDGVP